MLFVGFYFGRTKLQAECSESRQHAAQALRVILQRELGVRKAIEAGAVPAAIAALVDPSAAVRSATVTALAAGSAYQVLLRAVAAALPPAGDCTMRWIVRCVRSEIDVLYAEGGADAQARAVHGLRFLSKLANVRTGRLLPWPPPPENVLGHKVLPRCAAARRSCYAWSAKQTRCPS